MWHFFLLIIGIFPMAFFILLPSTTTVPVIDVDPPIKPLKHASGADTEVGGDHTVIASAYISYARRLNLECSKQMRVFSELVRNLSLLLSVSFFRLNHLSFYLPEMYIKLHKILFLDDDIVLQRDLTALWKIDMDGKVNEAIEICFGSFHRYAQYMNFSHPLIKEKFELDAWRKGKCIEAESLVAIRENIMTIPRKEKKRKARREEKAENVAVLDMVFRRCTGCLEDAQVEKI
ncbi:hypothetical protein ZIOFF_073609 [Zingiber officinale]|uniref:Hexosyltransferase n=1 Tax=Zingiber officinale TaxID=94328 RepID=A0A8J5EST4_ZINOF|nr:hypothetical protein ZIOFF_073609 [Zingiber officinale]